MEDNKQLEVILKTLLLLSSSSEEPLKSVIVLL